MVNTSLCSSEQDVKDAMRYESLKNEKIRVERIIFELDHEIQRLSTLKANEQARLGKYNSELDKLSDKPWIVYSTKGTDHG